MMSEHLAGLNEKLTQQKDEIDELRAQASSKVCIYIFFLHNSSYFILLTLIFQIYLSHC